MMHRALYLAEPGDVLVVVCAAPTTGAQWGDVAAQYALKKGLAGVVVHGCARDVDTVQALGFPVWSTYVSSIHPDKRGHGSVNVPIVCAGVAVNPGDLIVADGDGVLCVPRQCANEVVDLAIARMRKEDDAIAAIADGTSVWELSGAAASYERMDIEELDMAFDDVPLPSLS
jgi:4-hydroxy-4-methyl-2-oxoglutarate aldolase